MNADLPAEASAKADEDQEGLTQSPQRRRAEKAGQRGWKPATWNPQPGTQNPQPGQSVRRFRRGTQIGCGEEVEPQMNADLLTVS